MPWDLYRTWWHRTLGFLQGSRPVYRNAARVSYRPHVLLLEDRLAPAVATHFAVTALGGPNFSAGATISLQASALDTLNNVDTTYNGNFTISSSSTNISLVKTGAFSSGVTNFSAQLTQSGSQTITITASSPPILTGFTTVTINANGPVKSLSVTTLVNPVTPGVAFTITVTAQDTFGNTIKGYGGTIGFTKSDPGAGSAVPGNYTFNTATDNGVHTFINGVTLVTPGAATVTATDTVTPSITGTLSLLVNPLPAVSISPLTVGTWTQLAPSFPGTLTISGGTTPYKFVGPPTGVPPGLIATLTGSTISFTGAPTTAGTFNGSVNIVDNAGRAATQNFTITINAAPTISPPTVTQWTQGVATFNSSMTITGGTAPFGLVGAPTGLPPGVTASFGGNTITLNGIPTKAGTFNGTVAIKDATGAAVTKTFTIKINPPLAFVLPALATYFFRSPYSQVIATTGGTNPVITYTVNGKLPGGMTISPASPTTGPLTLFSCNVTALANVTITVTATDSVGGGKITKTYALVGAMPIVKRNGW